MEQQDTRGTPIDARLWMLVGLLLIALVAFWSYTPTPPSSPPEAVLSSERYHDVTGMAETMDALIGQLDALGSGEPLDMQTTQEDQK